MRLLPAFVRLRWNAGSSRAYTTLGACVYSCLIKGGKYKVIHSVNYLRLTQ